MRVLIALLLFAVTAGAATLLEINVGTNPNDGTGDSIRTFAQKSKTNFTTIANEMLSRTNGIATNLTVEGFILQNQYPTNLPAYISATGQILPVTSSPIDVKLFGATGDGTTDDYARIAAAHTFAVARRAVLFFPEGTYAISSTLFPHVSMLGRKAKIIPHSTVTNTSGLILMSVTNRQNLVIEGFEFDCGVGSHYNNGNIWIRGSTNVLVRNIVSRYGGYLANYVVGSLGGAPSVNCDIENSYILDQRYGSSGLSTACLSIAESARDCDVRNCVVDYPTIGTLGLTYNPPPPDATEPKAPSLAISVDRGFNCNIYDTVVRNSSGMTNITGITFEDNSGATNVFNIASRCFIDGVERGFFLHYIGGRMTISDCTIQNTTQNGLRMDQTEAADQHYVQSLIVRDTRFINCYTNATLGSDGSGGYYNLAGQARIVSNPDFRVVFDGCEFLTWTANTNFTHLLYGSGDLTVKNCVFQNGSFGVRAMDPAIPYNNTAANGFYGAVASNRKTFIHRDNRYLDVSSKLFGLYDPFGDENWDSRAYRYHIEDIIVTNVPVSALTRLFSIQTVSTASSVIGTSGSYYAVLDLLLSSNDTAVQTYGDVGSVGATLAWSQSVTDGGTESAVTSPVASYGVTMPAMTGTRGYTNVAVTVTSPTYDISNVNLFADPMGGMTTVSVYGKLRILHTGYFHPPIIVK